MAKKLNILIKAQLDKDSFVADIDKQLASLQKVLDGKGLKIDVNLGDAKELKQVTDSIGENVQKGMKASQDEMKKMQSTLEKLNKQMKEVDNNRASAIAKAKKDWEAMQKDTVWGKMKDYGVRRPMKGEQFYDEFKQLPDAVKKNKNYWKPGSQKQYNSIDQFLQESGLKMSPSKMMEEMKKGVPTFDPSKNLDPATQKGIAQGEKQVENIKKQIKELENAIKNQIVLTDKVENNIGKSTEAIKKQEKAVNNLANEWKKVSVATTSVGDEETSRITNWKNGKTKDKVVTRESKDENGKWVEDSSTYIKSLQEVDDARRKFQIKGEKWSDRLAKLHTDAFKMNDEKAVKAIMDIQKAYEKMDATTDKISMQKFEQDLKRVESQAKEQIATYDKVIKKMKELNEVNRKNTNKGTFGDLESKANKYAINSVDKNGGEKSLKQLDAINAKMKDRIDHLEAEKKRIKDLQSEQDKYYKKIKDYQSKGLMNSDRADMYKNVANKANNADDLKRLEKYFNQLDRVIAKEKAKHKDITQHMQVEEKANKKSQKATDDLEKAKDKLLKKLRDLGSTGKSTTDKLQRLGTSINTAKSLKELTQLEAKIEGVYNNEKKQKANAKEIRETEKLRKAKEAYYEKIKKYEQMGLGQGSADRYKSMADKGEFERLEKSLKALDKYMNKQKQLSQERDKDFQQSVRQNSQEAKGLKEVTDKQEALKKQLITLRQQGKITAEQLGKMVREVKTNDQIGELNKLENKIKAIGQRAKMSSGTGGTQAKNQPNEPRNVMGTIDSQQRLNQLTDAHIRQLIQTNDQYKNRRVTMSSVDRETGRWTATIRENGRQERVLRGEIDRTTREMVIQSDTLRDTSARNLGFVEQFRIALTRVPVWAAAMTAIYGTKRALEQMVSTIIEVDTQMTELKRVMDEDTDFNYMLEESVNLSKELGNNLTDVNKAMIGFARQGFEAQEALEMTNTAIVASNVSELTADEAMENLTAIMVQFNITAEDSIRIIDSLNEVDNNFAITTKNLADATAKAGATAQTFGVDLEEMIGHVTAIGVATRESGSVVGNGLKTIYSRLTTMDEATSALESVGIATKNMNGEMRSVTDILNELHSKWDSLSDAQQQNMGVTLAGRYQLSRFLALMNNYEMGLDATETALNSQGSAMRENEKYLQSMQAQINNLKVAWTEMSLAFGKDFLGATFVGVVQLLKNMAEAGTAVAEGIGVLPVLFGVIGTALVVLSPRMRTFAFALFDVSMYMTRAGVAALTLSGALDKLKLSVRSLMASFGLTAIFVAVGFALDAWIGKVQKAKEEEKALEEQQKTMVESYSKNKDAVKELISEYEELDEKTSKTTEEKKRYKDVANQLAELMPNLVDHIDSEGQAHLKNADAIKEELKYTKELTKLKQEEMIVNSDEKYSEMLKERSKALKDIKKIESDIEALRNGGTTSNNMGLMAGGVQDLVDREDQINKLEIKLKGLKQVASRNLGDVKKYFEDMTKTLLELDGVTLKNVDKEIEKIMKRIKGKDLADLGADGIASMSNEVANALKNIENASSSSQAQYGLESLKKALKELGLTKADINELTHSLYASGDAVAKFDREALDAIVSLGSIQEEYAKASESISVYNGLLEQMAEGKGITASEAVELIEKEEQLAEAITIENGMVNVNIKAVEGMRDAKIATFNDIIKARKADLDAQLSTLQAKIKNYGFEIQAIKSVAEAQNALNEAYKKRMQSANSIAEAMELERRYNESSGDIGAIVNAYERLNSLSGLTTTSLKQVGTELEKTNDKKKDSEKSDKESIYTTDQYARALEELALKFKQLESAQAKLPTWSDEYRDGLKKEISLLKQKEKLIENQIKQNEAYIKSLKAGKIPSALASNTDITSYGSGSGGGSAKSTTTTTTSSTANMKGWGGRVTSNYGMRNGKMHRGIDIAGREGTPLSANVSGKVIYAGWGKTGTGYGRYGNVVAIKSSSYTHLYAHLHKVYVKTGDNVKAGDLIGEIGNTGDSDGSHLHYEVRKSGYGTDVNPTNIAMSAKKGVVGDGVGTKVTTVSGGSSSSSKGISPNEYNNERLQLLDEKTLENLQLQQEKLDTIATIDQRDLDIVNSKLESYQRYLDLLDEDISASEIRNSYEHSYSKEYRDGLRSQLILMNQKIKKKEEELTYIRSQILLNKDLKEAQKDQLRGLLKEGQTALLGLQKTAQEKVNEISSSMLEQVMKDVEKTTRVMESKLRSVERKLSMTDEEDTKKQIELNKEKLYTLVEARKEAMKNVTMLMRIRNSLVGNKEALEQNSDAIRDYSEKIKDTETEIYNLKESIKDMYTEVADSVIDAMKDYYEERRDMELEALDKEVEAFEKAHQDKMKMYDDELKAFQDIVNAKIKSIDQQESEDQYQKELAEKQKNRQEIQNKIDVLSMDNSASARKEVSELKKQLAEADLELEEFIHQRGVELQKERLQEELDEYTKQKEEQKELAQEQYDEEKKIMDDKREHINKTYENILNDERYWAKIRANILNGNVEGLQATLDTFANNAKENMSGVGDSILQNLVDTLKKAKKELDSINGSLEQEFDNIDSGMIKDEQQHDKDKVDAGKEPNKNTTPPDPDEMPYWDGKQMAVGQIGRVKIVKPINLWQRNPATGKLEFSRILNPGEEYRVYGYDEKHGGQYNLGSNMWVTNMKGYLKYETPSADKLKQTQYQQFNTGGYTGNDEGLAMLHEKEIVLNKDDTENFLEAISMVRQMQSFFGGNNIAQILKQAILSKPAEQQATSDEYHFHIGKVEGTEKGAKKFADMVVKDLSKRGK
jgi:TP901 family phage tail tape measure protein